MKPLVLLLTLAVALCVPCHAGEKTAPKLRAGTAAVDITPKMFPVNMPGLFTRRVVEKVHDPLHARALVLADGTTTVALVVVDNLQVAQAVSDEAKAIASKQCGVAVEKMLVSSTHTHSAPASDVRTGPAPEVAYRTVLVAGIAESIVRAHAALRPAGVGAAVGPMPEEVFCRRWFLQPGKMTPNPFGQMDQVRTNPGTSPEVIDRPAGPVDPDITILSVQDAKSGKPLALLANYSLHYVGGAPEGMISADYYGEFARVMQSRTGGEFVAIMSNGTSGDINNSPFLVKRPARKPFEQIQIIAKKAAEAASRAQATIAAHHQDVRLGMLQRLVTLKVRHPTGAQVSAAKAVLAVKDKAERDKLPPLAEAYARNTLWMAGSPESVTVPVQALAIGELAVCGIPFEAFAAIGLDLKKRSPFARTMVIGLANGNNGYLPPPEQHKLGGYETWLGSNRVQEDASVILTNNLLEMLGELRKTNAVGADEKPKPRAAKPRRVDTVLGTIKPLPGGRKTQLPLYLWPAMDPGLLDAASAERLVEELARRGVGLVCSWVPRRAEATLAQGLAIARAQTRLGQAVNVDATACLQTFFNGDKSTAHIDADGHPFWDDSFNFGKTRYPIGCPFTLETRIGPIREQVESFVRAYQAAGMKVDFMFADWEIDGPLDYNRAHEAARRCQRCRERIAKIDDFLEFQKVVRALRSELQRRVLSTPVLDRFPHALVGNYAVYPHNGYRYWYDFFEQFVEGQPHIADQRARYRVWAHEFPGTGYTMAMPVLYTWYPTFHWYDFAETDYRWFYNMLLVASNVGRSTPRQVPIVSFVHWHTTAPPPNPDPQVKAMSRKAYQELLWHALLRGARTFYLWCPVAEDAEECQAVHEVYAAAQEYAEFIDRGVPVAFEVPKQPGAVVSGLLLGKRLLVRRTDFGPAGAKAEITVAERPISVPAAAGKCQVITLP